MAGRYFSEARNQARRRVVGVAGALFLLPLVTPALVAAAQGPTPAVLAAACMGCHGPDGHSTGAIPSLDDLDAAAIASSLYGFKSGEIEATVMNRVAKGYSDAEIDALAQYLGAM